MSGGFIELLNRARAVLAEQQRLSVRGLGRALELDGDELDEIIDELVDIQQVARREGKALVWIDARTGAHRDPVAAPLRPGYTPRHLADKILSTRASMEGEKKQVTVLFCDVVSSMTLAQALGPEAWHETLDAIFDVLTAAVHDSEGSVNQYTGDGIMALFGAPIAAEDHARRAGMAALAMLENLSPIRERISVDHGRTLSVRIGINSGEVVVGKIGDDLRMDYTAQGQVVGIAARLEALAQPDHALVSGFTAKLIEGFFELASLGDQEISGVHQAIETFELKASQSQRTRLDLSRERGFSKFVGRDTEMAMLKQAYKRAASGRGQLVSIVAPPGSGKSRLCWEFERWCRDQGALIAAARAQPHSRNVPYFAQRQVMLACYGLPPDAAPEMIREVMRKAHLAWDPRSQDKLALAYELVGVPDPDLPPAKLPPELMRSWAIKALTWTTQQLTKQQTVVFIGEDLQWWDESSLALWNHHATLAGQHRYLLISNFRPEFQPDWDETEAHTQRLPLQSLDSEALHDLLTAAAGDHPSLTGLGERLVLASGGNPFFFEEILRDSIERDILEGEPGAYRLVTELAGLPMPESVHNVLAARIDRLDEQDKQILQIAAVIGREFSHETLTAVSELNEEPLQASLQRMRRAEFIYPAEAGQFTFKHALTQDVAYGSLLNTRRSQLHRQVALWMDAEKNTAETDFARLSHHWEQAGDLEKAALAMHEAAKSSARRDLEESLRLRREFLRLEAAQPENPALLSGGIYSRFELVTWIQTLDSSVDDARRWYEEGCAMALRMRDPFRLGGMKLAYSTRLFYEARFAQSAALIEEVQTMSRGLTDPRMHININAMYAGLTYAVGGRVQPAIQATTHALELVAAHPECRLTRGVDMEVAARGNLGIALALSGQLQRGLEQCRLAARDLDENELVGRGSEGRIIGTQLLGGISDDLDGLMHRQETISLMPGAGAWWQHSSYGWLGAGCVVKGDFPSAQRWLKMALRPVEEHACIAFIGVWLRPLAAFVEMKLGQAAQARATLQLNEPLSLASDNLHMLALHCWCKCRILRTLDGSAASDNLRDTLALWEQTINEGGMELFRHLWWWETACLAKLNNDEPGHQNALRQALASAEHCGASGHAEDIRAELER